MRLIGTLTGEAEARALEDYLLSLDIPSSVRPQGDAWTIWVIHEDHLARAAEALEEFRADPDAPRFRDAARVAREKRRRADREEREYQKKVVDVRSKWDVIAVKARPVTFWTIVICAAIFLLDDGLGYRVVRRALMLFTIDQNVDGRVGLGLGGLQRGQVWRMLTPIFLHGGPFHILMNMLAFWSLAGAVESRYGGRFLLLFIGLAGVISNAGQALWTIQSPEGIRQFGGMSGVIFALFGFIFIRSRIDPTSGLFMSRGTVNFVLIFMLVCFTGWLGPIALAAHTAGLVFGLVYGLSRA